VGLIILSGICTVICVFPWVGNARRLRLKQRWSRILLGILGIRLDARLEHAAPGSLLVANHISWLDIFAINAAQPTAFVSKADVRQWPVIGWLAAMNDTIFLQRGSRGHARVINAQISARLAEGQYVGVFPEGTTTDGTRVLPFHGALLQAALRSGRPVVPLAITYWEENGERSLVPRYDGDISFGECLNAIAGRRRLTVRVQAMPPLGLAGEDRRTVAAAAQQAVSRALRLPEESMPPETPDDLADVPLSGDCPTGSPNPAPIGWATA